MANLPVVKRNIYNHDDSSKVFLLAILCPFLLSFLLSFVAQGLADACGMTVEQLDTNIWFSLASTLMIVLMYFGIWWGYNKLIGISPKAVGFNVKFKWHTYLILVAVAIVSIFGFQYIVQAFDFALKGVGYPLEEDFSGIGPTSVGNFIYCIFVLAVVPAVCEELLFRGVIFNGLRERFSSVVAVLLSGLLFALAHQNLQQLIYQFIFGCILSVVVLRTGSTVASMLVHLVNNLIVVTMNFVKHMTGFSFILANTWWFYLVAIGCALVAGVTLFLLDKFYFKHKNATQVVPQKTKTSKYFTTALIVGAVMYLLSVVSTVMFALQSA